MKKMLLLLFIFLNSMTNAQYDFFNGEDSTEVKCSNSSLDIGINSTGISFGNSENWNGIRINFSDCNAEKVNGINITLWNPKNNPKLLVNGLAFGLAPAANKINGISLGLAAVVAKKNLRGINIGGLAAVGGKIEGLNFSGLALVGKEKISEINFGGLATVAKGDISGINFGGFALVSSHSLKGINFGGLAAVSKENMLEFNFGGLAVVSENTISGLTLSGLAIVSKENIKGINIGGLGIVSKGDISGLNLALLGTISKGSIKGINIVGYKTEAENFHGINITPGWTDVVDLSGFSISSYHRIDGTQRGIVIGILNIAEELKGIQLGLINIAKNNRGITKVLPFINCHF